MSEWVLSSLRQIMKRRYQAYREVAKRMARRDVQVPEYADVRMVDGGAFVEAEIFVPESELPPELRPPR